MTAPADPAALAELAGLLADRTRAAFCLALIDGRAWTAGELARYAAVAPSTASEHLTRLVDAGFLVTERQGRHRYVRLADGHVAALVETLVEHLGGPPPPTGLRAARQAGRLAAARTCYDHLAGSLGVGIYDGLVARDLVRTEDGPALTPAGRAWFDDLAGAPGPGRVPLLRTCLDWTERRHHLGGRLGADLCRALFDRGWVVRGRDRRSVVVTDVGAGELRERLGVRT